MREEESYELRCASRIHGVIRPYGRGWAFEVRCPSRYCGKRTGVVILHLFDLETGKLIDTREYKSLTNKEG